MSISQVPVTLGARVRTLREEKGWSQSELAAKISGVKQQSIDQLEQGKVSRPRFLPELAEALQTNLPWLLTGEGERGAARPARMDTQVDNALLADVIVAVEQALHARDTVLEHKQKARLIAALYELIQVEEQRTVEALKVMAENLVKYDAYLGRSSPPVS